MIGPIVREMLLENQETFLIPAENGLFVNKD